ncbi:hypothetical protein MBLNU230_g6714t1, partial [Neophaeotheca triangularis]
MAIPSNSMLDTSIFDDLQKKIDEDVAVKDALRDIVQTLEKQDRATQATLSRAHSTPSSQLQPILDDAAKRLQEEIKTIQHLAGVASKYPYYKHNQSWTRDMQNACTSILLHHYLQTENTKGKGELATIDHVGDVMGVPVNVKDRDTFHLTIEEYLQALISLMEELARLARNTVTHTNIQRPMQKSTLNKKFHTR